MQSNGASKLWNSAQEWLRVIVIALAIALPIRFFIAEPFVVNGASMDPTFSTGQFLIVDRISWRFEQPKRGEVVVFRYPNDPSTYYIKRIIGLPGETVSIEDGKVTIKAHPSDAGTVLDETYIDSSHRSHETMHITLDKNHYFVMGDNRLQSSDSRVWGPLDEQLLIGRPFIRLAWPPSEVSLFPGEIDELI